MERVRLATNEDIKGIVNLSEGCKSHLMPCSCNERVVELLLSSTYVLDKEGKLEGAIQAVKGSNEDIYLLLSMLKRVPSSILSDFLLSGSNSLFIFQLICVGSGSFGKIIESLKEEFNLWCFCSINQKSYLSYIRHGFLFKEEDKVTFYNPHKEGNSTFQLGKYVKELVK